jgi:CHAT domain-containing protein/tetratricopeptide (TPR) repeat protein
LTRPSDRHLEDAEIDALVSSSPDHEADPDPVSGPILAEVRRHVESCEDCSHKVQMHRQVQSEISRLRSHGQVRPGPDCPSGVNWLHVAAGLESGAEARGLMTHAAHCDHCGPLLREAAETLSDEATAEEEQAIVGLRSSRQDWQREVAGKLNRGLLPRVPADSGRFQWWRISAVAPTWALAGMVFALFVIAAWLGINLFRPPSADQLLADAYSEHRSLEVRIAGAKYAPMRIERRAVGSNLDRPPSLQKAESLISENLAQHPNSPKWLQAKARADLLDRNYDSAIQSLQRALEAEPDSPQLLTDLASAYFERAQTPGRTIDYGNSIECLGKALVKAPDDPVARFNRAIVSEKMFLYAQAVDDWEYYLRVDPNSDWSNEARRHLALSREKQNKHDESLAEPLLEPKLLSKEERGNSATETQIDSRIEDYLKVAVREWLPQAFSNSGSSATSSDAQVALYVLASVTTDRHADRWLTDLLVSSSKANFRGAVTALTHAIRANDVGDYATAQLESNQAERLFATLSNDAGVLRSRFENIFALHQSHDGASCLRAVSATADQMADRPYQWLQIQYHLEESSCRALMGDLGGAQRAVTAALKQAQQRKYATAYLRALGFASEDYAETGNLSAAWTYAHTGLETFWSGTYSQMTGYNLYTDSDTAAEVARQPYLQVALWRQALLIISANEDPLLRAMAHSWAGNAAFSAGLDELARHEFTEASNLFAAAPQTKATRNDRVEAETWIARLEARRGYRDLALSRLQGIQSDIALLSDHYVAINFYTTLGEVQLHRNATNDAESALHSAIALAELTLRSLKSEQDRLTWVRQSSGAYKALVELMLRQGDPQGALEVWEWYRGAALRSGEYQRLESKAEPFATLSPRALAEGPSLPALNSVADGLHVLTTETILSYAVLAEKMVVWVYDDRGVSAKWIPESSVEVERTALRLNQLCSDPKSNLEDVRRNSRTLYDLLIAPMQDRLVPLRTLVIEADGPLTSIPIEALLDPHDRYLGDNASVVSSLGFYYYSRLRSDVQFSPAWSALVVSVPDSEMVGESLSPLSDAMQEAESVAAIFGRGAHILKGSDATLLAVRRELPAVDVFHFVGHATASVQRTGLLLSDTILDPTMLRTNQLQNLQLAVLSACDTARGTGGRYDDVDSFARAFIHARVPHVVASRWSVQSAATTTFMNDFYRALLSGATVSASLREAEADLRSRPETRHPYYWSAFGAFGTN